VPYAQLPDFHMDVLKEVGTIGAGHAATALSQLLDKPIDMRVPQVRFLPFEEIVEILGGAEKVVVSIYMRVVGDCPGHLFFMIDRSGAKQLLRHLAGIHVLDEAYSEMEISALCEIGNILAGSYLSSLADFTHLWMTTTVPSMTEDMAGAVLSFSLMQYGAMGDHALLIDTELFAGKRQVEGHFFLVPDPGAFEAMFKALGVPLE
jgi:chemotaxis protein CheC